MRVKLLTRVGFVAMAILAISATTSLAQQQSERYPTATELQRLREKLRQQIRSSNIQDRRSPAEKQSREAFVRAWSRVAPAVSPFLGDWSGYEESLSIYPSNTSGRVCLIYIGIQEAELSLGTVSNGQIRTNRREVILKEGDYLGVASVRNNQPDIFVETPYHSPVSLPAPRQFAQSSGTTTEEVNKVVREFNASGCRLALPSLR
ncbi:hypothetical protein MiSe_02490 [Microseira wollei NIES-4236]|uniref:Uncharacterized protein n=2 Tax=Microseira wollei TaxID=467598 RepID=A0AAV3WYT1_9CYAN|nr:hypothetical protein MiSe_02490 [Microseira wollei NIES-4236]